MLCLSYGRSGSHRFYFWYRRQHRRRSRHLPARLNDLQKSKLENPSKNNQNRTSFRIILTFCTNIELGADGKTYHEYVQALQHCGASAFENVRFFASRFWISFQTSNSHLFHANQTFKFCVRTTMASGGPSQKQSRSTRTTMKKSKWFYATSKQ